MTGWTPQGIAIVALLVAVLVLGRVLIGPDDA